MAAITEHAIAPRRHAWYARHTRPFNYVITPVSWPYAGTVTMPFRRGRRYGAMLPLLRAVIEMMRCCS